MPEYNEVLMSREEWDFHREYMERMSASFFDARSAAHTLETVNILIVLKYSSVDCDGKYAVVFGDNKTVTQGVHKAYQRGVSIAVQKDRVLIDDILRSIENLHQVHEIKVDSEVVFNSE